MKTSDERESAGLRAARRALRLRKGTATDADRLPPSTLPGRKAAVLEGQLRLDQRKDTMNTNESGETIEEREAHIIALARIVGTPQGERKPSAIHVAIRWNRDKSNLWVTWPCGHSSEEGDTTWNAHLQGDCWKPVCRECLPAQIEGGEAILDRRSAHETLAGMLGGREGAEAYLAYNDPLGELPF